MKIFGARGGLWIFRRKSIDTYLLLTSDGKFKRVAMSSAIRSAGQKFEKDDYKESQIPFDIRSAQSVWDWACAFCYERLCGQNEYERSMMTALTEKTFMRIARNVSIMEWDDINPYDIDLFYYESHNELARSAHFWASEYGVIRSPKNKRPSRLKDKRIVAFEDVF